LNWHQFPSREDGLRYAHGKWPGSIGVDGQTQRKKVEGMMAVGETLLWIGRSWNEVKLSKLQSVSNKLLWAGLG